jgi:hypothetical protein
VALETSSVGALLITAKEARYVAARLLRLAWRLDARRRVTNQSNSSEAERA